MHKGYSKRRDYLVGRPRIDQSSQRLMMPEETGTELDSVIMIGETRLEGGAKRMGVPSAGDYEEYAQARMLDLHSSLASRTAPHVKGSAGSAFAEFETRIILGRYKFIHAVEHYLTCVRQPAMPHGVVWRYLCHLVGHLWLNREVSVVGFGRDLVTYSLSAPLSELAVRAGNETLCLIAAQSIETDWLYDAQSLYASSLGPPAKGAGGGSGGGVGMLALSPAPPTPAGDGGAADSGGARCSCCGGLAAKCGGYSKPAYSCQKNVQLPCKSCGCKHMDRGPRLWKCAPAQHAVAGLTAAEQGNAFRVSSADFALGRSTVSAGSVAKLGPLPP